MQHIKVPLHISVIFITFLVSVVMAQNRTVPNATEGEFPTRPGFEFPDLKTSDVLRAKAMLKWMINNRTENGTKTFNAGFIRLIFHDCVGGCDGCVNLRNPSNAGLGFYKLPLDLMYRDFIFPMMSRADWYALAGITAVEYAAELTPCRGRRCKQPFPELNFLYGRRDCVTESNVFRFIPGPTLDPRFTIRNTFRLNFVEITALMGAHCLGKNHQRDTRWVDDGTRFDNQYYKDMLADHRDWRRGNGTAASEWTSKTTGNVMLSSDMFMAFDVSNPEACDENPMANCNKTNTFQLVQLFASDNEFWMREFAVAFNVMLMNGNFGRLRIPKRDTLDKEWKGNPDDLFRERNTDTDYEFDREAFGLPPLPVANATNNATDNAGNTTTNAAGAAGDGAAQATINTPETTTSAATTTNAPTTPAPTTPAPTTPAPTTPAPTTNAPTTTSDESSEEDSVNEQKPNKSDPKSKSNVSNSVSRTASTTLSDHPLGFLIERGTVDEPTPTSITPNMSRRLRMIALRQKKQADSNS